MKNRITNLQGCQCANKSLQVFHKYILTLANEVRGGEATRAARYEWRPADKGLRGYGNTQMQ